MITNAEFLRVLLLPLVASAIIALVGRWRGWPWVMPLAAGVGFLAGWAAVTGAPGLPPSDGTDWLFWLAIPAVVLGIVDSILEKRAGWRSWGVLLGLATGGVAWAVVLPLVPAAVLRPVALAFAATAALAGVAWTLTTRAVPRVGGWAVGTAISVVVGMAAVAVLSANLRVVGVYGIAAAAAVGPAGVLAGGRLRDGIGGGLRGVVLVAACLTAGLLAGGRFYPEPGVTTTQLLVLAAAPLLLWAAAFLPTKRRWLRGVIGVALVAAAAGGMVIPAAIAAKHAAEDDPYAAGE